MPRRTEAPDSRPLPARGVLPSTCPRPWAGGLVAPGPILFLLARLVLLALLVPTGLRAGPEGRARSFYRLPVRARPAPGYFRPRRHFAGLVTAMAVPPGWGRERRMGLGVWIEHPDRPPERPTLPFELHAGDRVRTGPRGLARVLLPGEAMVWISTEASFRLSGDGPFPKRRERIRIGVKPGLIWVRSPWRRPLEIEVAEGLLHLEWGEVLVEVPQVLDDSRPQGRARIFLSKGRGRLHGRGRWRSQSRRLRAGQTLTWDHPDPVYWKIARTIPAVLADLREYFVQLEDGQLAEVQAADPYAVTLPRKVEGLVYLHGVGGPTLDRPDPVGPGFRPPEATPTTRPTPPPPPVPTEDPFKDPFGEDPFGEDPFGDDPFGEDPFGDPPDDGGTTGEIDADDNPFGEDDPFGD